VATTFTQDALLRAVADPLDCMGPGALKVVVIGMMSTAVTILTGKTLDSAVMTTRAEKYH
jgi:hypothetical protein